MTDKDRGTPPGSPTPDKDGGITLPRGTSPGSPTPETDKDKLEKLLRDKSSELQTTINDIDSLPAGATASRINSLKETRRLLERDKQVLSWTIQLHELAQGVKKGGKIDKDKENGLWTAITPHRLNFKTHQEDDKDWDELWKLVDPMLEQLWRALGNKESFHGSNKTYATGADPKSH